MKTEELEQMKRELAENWGHKTYYRREDTNEYFTEALPEFLSDLTTLLDKQREVMMEFIKWFTGSQSPVAILYGEQAKRFATLDKDYTIDELFNYWFKNVKK